MEDPPRDEASSLFFELAGDLRLCMIKMLAKKKYRLSQIASELEVTMQETHRNILRLVESGLVVKDHEGDLVLTPYGKSVVSILPSYEFLFDNKEYFIDHTLESLPLEFIHRIGSLSDCETVHGVVAILQRWKTLYTDSQQYIKEIMAQVPLDLIETVSQRVHSGIKFSYIFSSNAVIPKGRTQILQKVGWRNFIAKGIVERRMLDSVSVMTILNERQACVMFPNLRGEPDLNIMFYSERREFHDWCEDYFMYQWRLADTFDEARLKPEI